MTEDSCPGVSSAESIASAESSSATKQRKRRKWDQPAESLVSVSVALPSFVSASVALPGILPLGNIGSLAGVTPPGAATASGALLTNPLMASSTTIQPVFQAPLIQTHTTSAVPKINQPKIQDELIAREIVINDADSAVRYKLTKRQTQEEIQKLTGAVVITRGKYRPQNTPSDGEKPLYLHISAGAHLETTVERIKAVDRAAAMVEEMLKQGSVSNGGKVTHPLSTCVYLGFEADPSLNIAARIRGPNDQYINHIMNETGATVLLRGCGSGNSENAVGEEGQQPLHLFLSSSNPKSLESAKLLAENLLDTISIECGASRVSSSKVYGAVPPPQQLLAGVQSTGNELKSSNSSTVSLTSTTMKSAAIQPVCTSTLPVSQSLGLSCGNPQPDMACYPQPSLTGGTSYIGYGGIYPQATPLQQVALALRQSSSLVSSTATPPTVAGSTSINSSGAIPGGSSSEKEKRPPSKRKFQELPVASKGHANPHQNSLQVSEFSRLCETASDLEARNFSTLPPPRKLIQPSVNGMHPPPPKAMPPPPPPPKAMPPPPPPPKFNSSTPASKVHENSVQHKSKLETVPDTLIKLMEYGEEDDDLDDLAEEQCKSNSKRLSTTKPFWAV
ncbi:hypothetical protein NMG60_11006354 [Bertholletia excelsa]